MWILVKQVIFLTVNHRGPLPLRELHSTDDTECGETLGDLESVCDPFMIAREITLCPSYRFSYGESLRTLPLEETSLHRRNTSVERPWGNLSLVRPVYDYQ